MDDLEKDSEVRHLQVDCVDRVRLDRWLSEKVSAVSRSRLQKAIRNGDVLVDGEKVSPREMVSEGRVVQIREEVLRVDTVETAIPLPQELPLDILYEDECILVLNKAPGMVVHPGNGCSGGTIVNGALHHCGELPVFDEIDRPGVIHRLDKETTGALIIAKTERAGRELMRQFHDRETRKSYLAVVQGWDLDDSGVCEGSIGRDSVRRTRMAVTENGRSARSTWEVHERCYEENWAVVQVEIETGRTHQIRVHLSNEGYPILGDSQYGFRKNRSSGQARTVSRVMLHAAEIAFDHPETGQRMVIEAPVPPDMGLYLKSNPKKN